MINLISRTVHMMHIIISIAVLSNFKTAEIKAQNFNLIQKIVETPRNILNTNNHYGDAISIDGDFAIVGAPNAVNTNSRGEAFIYERILGNWIFRQRIVPNDSMFSSKFGKSVYIKGNLVIVGDPFSRLSTSPSSNNVGAAYIFQRQTNGIWVQIRQLRSPNPTVFAQFGLDVAIENDVAVVGERGYNTGIPTSGAAHVFRRSAGNWANIPNLTTLLGDQINGDFGISVDIDGSNLIVGQSDDNLGNSLTPQIGSVFLFSYNAGTWSSPQKIIAGDGDPMDFFGWSVAINGEYAIVGSYPHRLDANGNLSLLMAGAAYILRNTNGTWSLHQKIVASDRTVESFPSIDGTLYGSVFGFDVDIDGNQAIVGAFAASRDPQGQNLAPFAGAAYIFRKEISNNWIETQKIVGLHRDSIDNFGKCVSISGFDIAVGASNDWDDVNGNPANRIDQAGSAYFFAGECPLSITKRLISSNPSTNQPANYEIEICNPCAINLNNIRVTDTLPQELSAGLLVNNFNYNSLTRHFEKDVSIPANSCITLQLSVLLNTDADCCGNPIQITNCANAFSVGSNVSPLVSSCHTLTTSPVNGPVSNTTNLFSILINNNNILPVAQAVNIAQNIIVTGTWIMDIPTYTFAAGSVLTMAAGAQIIVQENNVLRINNSTVKNDTFCNFMWRSITVDAGARLFLDSTSLTGGQYAVEALHKSFILVKACNFTDNFIGIYVPPANIINPQQVGISAINFTNNRFRTNNGLPVPFPGHPVLPVSPIAGSIGLAGIFLNDLSAIDIRQSNPLPVNANNFDNLASGIVAINSTVLANGCIFNNISLNNPYQIRYNGTAIYLSGQLNANQRLEYNGYGATSQINFNNVNRAITVLRAGLITSNNRIRRANVGIAARLCLNRIINISNNNISAYDIGIELFQNDAATTSAIIQSNQINVDVVAGNIQGQAGIYLTENNNTYPLQINANTISLGNISNGIVIQGNNGGNILENTISLRLNYSFRTGLFATGTTNTLFSCNDVSGTSIGNSSALNQRAYWISGSTADFTCNSADLLPVGMQFDAANNIKIRGTRFDRHFYGIWLRPNSTIGNQPFAGNRFVANTPFGQRWEAINQSFPNSNIFTVNAPLSSPLLPSPRFPNTGWFTFSLNGTNFDCNSPLVFCSSGPILRLNQLVNNLDTLVATGNLSVNPEVNEHIGKRQLYRKLKESGNPGGIFQSFSNNEVNTPVGFFDRISELNDSLCHPNSICIQQSQSLQVIIEQYSAQIRLQDSLYTQNGNLQHLSQIDIIQDSIISKTTQESQIWTNIENVRQSSSDILEIDNSNIAVSTIYEENEKKVNEVYLNTIAKGSFDYDSIQLTTLEIVASQCPWEGGTAVFRARGLLALVKRVIINDESMCSITKSLLETYENKTYYEDEIIETELGTTISPNPVNDILNIAFKEDLNSNIEAQIIDINGRIIKRQDFKAGKNRFELNTSGITVGIYILRLADNQGKIVAIQKILIMR